MKDESTLYRTLQRLLIGSNNSLIRQWNNFTCKSKLFGISFNIQLLL